MTREQIIKEIQELCPYSLNGITGDVAAYKVADYIIRLENELLDKINAELNTISSIIVPHSGSGVKRISIGIQNIKKIINESRIK